MTRGITSSRVTNVFTYAVHNNYVVEGGGGARCTVISSHHKSLNYSTKCTTATIFGEALKGRSSSSVLLFFLAASFLIMNKDIADTPRNQDLHRIHYDSRAGLKLYSYLHGEGGVIVSL